MQATLCAAGGSVTVGQRAKTSIAVAERRRKVAALDLRHVDQVDIGRQLDVDQSTVSRDLAVLRAEWRAAAAADTGERTARELAELDDMERDCAVQFAKTHDRGWITARLAIKDRRAALLGLDAPKRTELSGRGGGPIDLRVHPEFLQVQTVILLALEHYPQARQAVADALAAIDDAGH